MFYLQNYEESDSENCPKRNDNDESFHSLNKTTTILHSFDAPQFIFKPRHVSQLILDSNTKDESISDLIDSFTSQPPKSHSTASHTRNGEQEKIKNIEMKDWNQFEISTDSIQGCRRFSMASSISSFCDAERKKPPIYESTPISKAMANRREETLSSDQLNHRAGIPSDYVGQSRIFNQSLLRSQKNEGIRASNENARDGKSIVTSRQGTNHKSSNNLIQSINKQDNLEKELKRTNQSDSHHTSLHQHGDDDDDDDDEHGDNSNNNNNAQNCSYLHQLTTNRDSLLLPKQKNFKYSDINNVQKPSNNQTLPLTNQIQEMINSFQTLTNCGRSDSYLSLPSSQSSRTSSDAKKSSETLRGSKLGNHSMHVTTRKETMTTNQSREWEEFEKIVCNRNNVEKARQDCEEFEREYLKKFDRKINDVESGSKKTFQNLSEIQSNTPLPQLSSSSRPPQLSSSSRPPELSTSSSQPPVFSSKSLSSYKSSKPSLSSQSLHVSSSSSPSNTRNSLGRSLRASDPKFLQLRDTYEFMRLSLGEGRPMGNRFFDHHGNDSTITLEPNFDDFIEVRCKVEGGNASIFDSLRVKGQDLNYQVVHGVRVPFLLPSNNSSNENIMTASNMTANNILPISHYIIHKEMTSPKKMEYKFSPKQNIQQLQQEHCHSNKIIVTKGDQLWNQSAEEMMGNNLDTPSTTSNSFLPPTKDEGIQVEGLRPGFEPTDSASDHHETNAPLLHPAKSSDMNEYEFNFKSIIDARTCCGAFTPEFLDLECPSTLDSLDMLPEKIDVEGNVIMIAPTAWTISFSDESLEAKSLEELLRLKRPDIIKSLGKRSELLNCKYLTSDPPRIHFKFQAVERGSKDSKYGQLGRSFTHHPCTYSNKPKLSTNKPNLSTNQSSLSLSHRPVASSHQCTTPTPTTKYCTPVNQDPRISKTLTIFKHASFHSQNNLNIVQKKALPKSKPLPLSSSANECKVKPKPLNRRKVVIQHNGKLQRKVSTASS